jgi:effector-binding domain-containing protein
MARVKGGVTALKRRRSILAQTKGYRFGRSTKKRAAHDAIDKWMKANGKIAAGAPWEVYVTDPSAEKDTTKWLTEVIYPVK